MYKVLTVTDSQAWQDYLKRLSVVGDEPYVQAEYLRLYETETAYAQCFVYERGESLAMYPYLKSKVDPQGVLGVGVAGDYYDIEGAYGYNGMLFNTDDLNFRQEVSHAFMQYCAQENIIVEWVRLNPLLGQSAKAEHWQLEKVSQNVIVDLMMDEDIRFNQSYLHCVRKNINQALKSGITIKSIDGGDMNESWLKAFVEVYHHTMDRRDSDKKFYFDQEFWHGLAKGLASQSLFVFALKDQKVVSCELVLLGKRNAYSFLGGTLEEFQSLRANNLLKHELIGNLKNRGLKYYCIGGGRQANDGIFRYKAGFAKEGIVDFYIGKAIHDPVVYQQFCAAWDRKYPQKIKTYGKFFLKYRF